VFRASTSARAAVDDELGEETDGCPQKPAPRPPRTRFGPWNGPTGRGQGLEVETRPVLRFSSPRDPAVMADFVRLRVIDPDERDWTRGYLAGRRFLCAHNHLRIPLDARDGHDHG